MFIRTMFKETLISKLKEIEDPHVEVEREADLSLDLKVANYKRNLKMKALINIPDDNKKLYEPEDFVNLEKTSAEVRVA